MKRAVVERNIVVALFILVLIAFSLAEKDSKKLDQLYTKKTESFEPVRKEKDLAASESKPNPTVLKFSRN